jgi:hypothetical protein
MQQMDGRGILASTLLRGSHGAKKSGKSIAFRCPRHSDSTASAWLGEHAWGCSACGFTEPLRTLGEELGVALPDERSKGLTLAEYCERKELSRSALERVGVTERVGQYGDPILAIPYRDATGQTIRTKLRTRTGTFWDKDGIGTPLYGQDVLAQTPRETPVLLVEGESDCHAGWQRDLCVVGLPGASQWKTEYTALLKDRPVFVWQEPDEGGATLVAAVARDVPKARVIRDVVYEDSVVKDLCDLHQRIPDDDEFSAVMQTLRDRATPIGAEAPAMQFDSITGQTLAQILDEKLAPIDAVPTPLPGWNTLCHGGAAASALRGAGSSPSARTPEAVSRCSP